MRGKTLAVVAGALLVMAGGAASLRGADTTGRWIHIRVMEKGDKGETVRVNLPVSVLETMASSIEAEHMKDGRIQLGNADVKAEDLRAMWQSIRSSRDMEFVTVESGDETVRVAKSGDYLLARVHGQDGDKDRDKDGEKVEVKVPIKVVDALLDAPEGQLNVKAALQVLAAHDAGDLVQVHDGDSHVRIWIDSRADTQD